MTEITEKDKEKEITKRQNLEIESQEEEERVVIIPLNRRIVKIPYEVECSKCGTKHIIFLLFVLDYTNLNCPTCCLIKEEKLEKLEKLNKKEIKKQEKKR